MSTATAMAFCSTSIIQKPIYEGAKVNYTRDGTDITCCSECDLDFFQLACVNSFFLSNSTLIGTMTNEGDHCVKDFRAL